MGGNGVSSATTEGATPGEVTELLQAWRHGDTSAIDRLMPMVYSELRRLAGHHLQRERHNHTLDPTALVHEAYLRLVEQRQLDWQSRAHFVALAATMMRRVLLNHARQRQTEKRNGSQDLVSLAAIADVGERRPEDIVALDDALTELAQVEPRLARIVELRIFGGFTVDEAARYLELSPATLKRDWRMARAWLYRALTQDPATRRPSGSGA